MRYGQIRKYDIANGPGIRTTIFVTGCTRQCKNCFNQDYQDFDFGRPWTDQETELTLDYLSREEVAGLTILGGEPFENTGDLVEIVQKIRARSKKPIWIYSGFLFEELIEDPLSRRLLSLVQVLVDGPFIEELKDLNLEFRGSSNQRILDLEASLKLNQPVSLDL